MITKQNVDTDDLMQVAKYMQYKPSSDDLTKEEMANEVVVIILKDAIENAWLKEDRQVVTKRTITITSVQ